MKKFITIIAMMLFTPFAAFGLTALPDCELNNITGQIGISIDPEVDLNVHIGAVAWDGTDSLKIPDFGVNDINATLHVGVRTDLAAGDNVESLTISMPDGTGLYSGATFVRIGLGTLAVNGADIIDQATGNVIGNTGADINLDIETDLLPDDFGNVDITGLEILTGYINAAQDCGYVDIFTPAGSTGVTLGLNVLLESIEIDSLALDIGHIILDLTSLSTTYNFDPGYIGLTNVAITDLAVTGELVIGMGDDSTALVLLTLGDNDGTATAADLYIQMATLDTTVTLGDAADFSGNGTNLGTIAMNGTQIAVDGTVGITVH